MAINDYKMNQGHLIKSHREKERKKPETKVKAELQLARGDTTGLIFI